MSGRPTMRRLAWSALAACLAVGAGTAVRGDEEPSSRHRLLVLGADGHPLDAVRVTEVTERTGQGWLFEPHASAPRVPLAEGVLDAPPPAPETRRVLWRRGHAATLAPDEEGVVGVRLSAAAPIAGLLRFERGDVAADVRLVARPRGPGELVHRTRTDETGRFRFDHLAPGSWEVVVIRTEGRWQSIGAFAAGTVTGEQRLWGGARLQGQVLDGDASRRTGVETVELRLHRLPPTEEESADGPTATTDANGRFGLPDVPAGVYEAELVTEGWSFHPTRPRVEAPASGTLRLRGWYVLRHRAVTGRVVGPDDEAVEGAVVHLVPDPTAARPAGDWPPVAPARTDADGRFRLDGVRPAPEYRIVVGRDGFCATVEEPFEVVGPADTEVPTVRLLRGWRLEVRVRAPGGAPVRGAEVRVVPARHPVPAGGAAWGQALVHEALTDAEGKAVLEGLPADEARVRAGGPGLRAVSAVVPYPRTGDVRTLTLTLFPTPALRGKVVREEGVPASPLRVRGRPRGDAGARPDEAEIVTAVKPDGSFVLAGLADVPTDVEVLGTAAGATVVLARVDGVMPGATPFLEILVPKPVRLRGRVEGIRPGGGPVRVVLEAPRFDAERGDHVWRTVASRAVEPGADGATFAFPGLAPGPYAVRAVQGANDGSPQPVFANEGDVDDLLLTLPDPARIAGTVLDARDLPVLGAEVRLSRLRGEGEAPGRPGGPLHRVTDADGGWVFEDVAPGLWRVEVADEGLAPEVLTVRLREGESLVVRDVRLHGGGTLAGSVADADGRPLDGATLVLDAVHDGVPERSTRTGREGRFRVEGLRAGVWRLRLDADVGAFSNLETLVEIVDGQTTEVVIAAAGRGRIEGRVSRGGRPVVDAVLHLWSDEGGGSPRRLETRSDGEGAFAWDGLEAGAYEIDLVDGGVRSTRGLQLFDGDTLRLDLEAWEGRLAGEVRVASGPAVAGATVVARPRVTDALDVEGRVRTDPAGRFLIAGLPLGVYDLSVSAPGLPPGRLYGVVAETLGSERYVTVTLGLGGTLVVRVRDEQGRGIGGARLWLETEEGAPLHARPYVTTNTGRMRLDGVPPGAWWLRVHAAGYGRGPRRPLRMTEGQTTDVELVLGVAARLSLTVAAQGRDPVTRTRVDLLRLPEEVVVERRRTLGRIRLEPPWGHLPRTGALSFEDLGPGRYLIVIDAGPLFEALEIPIEIAAGEDVSVRVDLAYRLPDDR